MNLIIACVGVLFVALAGMLATRNWTYIARPSVALSKRRAVLGLIGSFILLLLGGFLSTYFWDQHFRSIESALRREAMGHLLAAEWMINDAIFRDPALIDTTDENLSTFVVFPSFQTMSLEAFFVSGLFVGESDRELFTVVVDLLEKLQNVNDRLRMTQIRMLIKPDPDEIADWRRKIRDGQTLNSLRVRHRRLKRILLAKYGIAKEDVFFIKLDY